MNENPNNSLKPLIIAITGASGIGYGIRLLEALSQVHLKPYLILSESAEVVTKVETNYDLNQVKKKALKIYSPSNIAAEVASGSFKDGRMVDCP